MTPIQFPQSNKTLLDNGYRSEGCPDIADLPAWSDGEIIVSCWKMSWRERLSALVSGKAWISVLSPTTHPPIAVNVTREYFSEV